MELVYENTPICNGTYKWAPSKKRVADLIETLPEKEKTVLALYYVEELTMGEIGKVLSITESQVCQIHNRALGKLKERIKQLS
jgi:RNA polymerase sigma factor for flagellar operon FliA